MQDVVKNTGIYLDNVQNKTRGPSYWKFDNSLCDDIDYCCELNEVGSCMD